MHSWSNPDYSTETHLGDIYYRWLAALSPSSVPNSRAFRTFAFEICSFGVGFFLGRRDASCHRIKMALIGYSVLFSLMISRTLSKSDACNDKFLDDFRRQCMSGIFVRFLQV